MNAAQQLRHRPVDRFAHDVVECRVDCGLGAEKAGPALVEAFEAVDDEPDVERVHPDEQRRKVFLDSDIDGFLRLAPAFDQRHPRFAHARDALIGFDEDDDLLLVPRLARRHPVWIAVGDGHPVALNVCYLHAISVPAY